MTKIISPKNISNFSEIYKFLNKQKISEKIYNPDQATNILNRLFTSKRSKKNIKNKINVIGQKILKRYMEEINLILNKI